MIETDETIKRCDFLDNNGWDDGYNYLQFQFLFPPLHEKLNKSTDFVNFLISFIPGKAIGKNNQFDNRIVDKMVTDKKFRNELLKQYQDDRKKREEKKMEKIAEAKKKIGEYPNTDKMN